MNKSQVPPSSLNFLKAVKKNNNRDWFAKHKDEYLEELEHITAFADALLIEMNKHDSIETPSGKKSLHRIYRDTRFSKDKTPYKTNWSGSFSRATKKLRGGYYFHIEPGNSFIGGGFWGPNPDDLKRIREEFVVNGKEFRKIMNSKSFKDNFRTMQGEQLKTAPQGFEKDHPEIDLIRYKQFLLYKGFTDKEVLSPGFVKQVSEGFRKMRPFLDYMSEALTTDLNGISLV